MARVRPKFAEVHVVPRVNTLVAALVATSAVMLAISFFIDGTWSSNLLLQVGSSVILLVPFVWITKWLEGQIEESESRTQTTVLELNREVERIQADLARTAAEITGLVSQRFANERNKDREVLAAVNTAPSREDIVRALRRASELEIISTFGVRVPLKHTGLYLLFPQCAHMESQTNDDLKIRLQTHELKEVMCVNWGAGISPVDFFHELGIMLRDTNHWYGDESYTPGTVLDTLSRIFDLGYETIVKGNSSELDHIFELVEGVEIDDSWAVTETALVHPKHFYHVPYRRFNELNWERHLNEKTWVNKDVFRDAFDVGVFLIRDKYVEGVLPDYLPGLWKSHSA